MFRRKKQQRVESSLTAVVKLHDIAVETLRARSMIEPSAENEQIRLCLQRAAGNMLSTWAMFESSRTQRPMDEFMGQAQHLMTDMNTTAEEFITQINADPIFDGMGFSVTAMDEAFGDRELSDAFAMTTQQLAQAVVEFNARGSA